MLEAFLEPVELLKSIKLSLDYSKRLAIQEELKSLPFGVVWDNYCEEEGILNGKDWIEKTKHYETETMKSRK